MDERLACEHPRRLVILGDRDVEVAVYALVLLELQVGPLALVDKLLQRLLEVVEHRGVGSLDLIVVDGDLGVELLRSGRNGQETEQRHE